MNLNFDCKPQRFLKTGELPIEVEKNGISRIQNPTGFSSLPLIRVFGTSGGTLTIGDQEITISDFGNEIVIDSEIQDVYLGTTNKNSLVKFMDKGFPSLGVGETSISFTGGITKVEVTPRWYTI